MKPLISYYGGKQRIASKILKYFPPHSVYVEPFAGGAALLFAKPVLPVGNGQDYRECLNDTSDLLINLYRVAIKYPDELNREIQATLYSQSDHRRAIAICKNPEGYTDLEKAWAYYLNINTSFAKKLNSGWGTGVYGGNLSYGFLNKKLNLPSILGRLKNVHVACEDAIRCISRWDSPQTLFYCDPPYPNTDLGHYKGYSIEDWQALCNTLDNIQGSYVLSNYPQPIEPQSAQQRVEMEATMSASGVDRVGSDRTKDCVTRTEEIKRAEVLWVCDRSKSVRPSLVKVLEKNQQLMLDLWG
jgi:DNA adenine methylase